MPATREVDFQHTKNGNLELFSRLRRGIAGQSGHECGGNVARTRGRRAGGRSGGHPSPETTRFRNSVSRFPPPVLTFCGLVNVVGAMFRFILCAASAAFLGAADAARAGSDILVSCYRGPWHQVIWDRANPEFIASLEAIGIEAVEARVIADSICRDPRLVNNPDEMAAEVRRVVSEARRS